MRGKRSKAYRKLMSQYQMSFGFREPYQVLVDAEIVKDATKAKMDLAGGLERTLHGQTKPMITQCSIRHLYKLSGAEFPDKDLAIDTAKRFERRRCNHHELEEPLPEKECIESVVVHNGENKHRYCVATQIPEVRQALRAVPGVPLIYINRSVMIMEAMAPISAIKRERGEMVKFRLGIKDTRPKPANAKKRKRDDDNDDPMDIDGEEGEGEGKAGEKKKKRQRGPKGPNPLSVKKKKKPEAPKPKPKPKGEGSAARPPKKDTGASGAAKAVGELGTLEKRKRRRKHGKGNAGEEGATTSGEDKASGESKVHGVET
ncbi:Fcf1-domain-containing protein [Morchella snyderi]|nr:Fcf1-domain-containing protein [Morchella snyderi]